VIIEPGLCQDQTRQINGLPSERSLGERQLPRAEQAAQPLGVTEGDLDEAPGVLGLVQRAVHDKHQPRLHAERL
jgi:hypothetical protein